jgi:hypothetical protein
MKQRILTHEFVQFIPEKPEEGKLYVCIEYATVVHKCVCGCRQEVVTPISPTDWQLTFDGRSISLFPSIGNWSFHCQSHYWIKNNRIIWAPRMSKREIAMGRAFDRQTKEQYFAGTSDKANARAKPEKKRPEWLHSLKTKISTAAKKFSNRSGK